jgi:hypothetical protein
MIRVKEGSVLDKLCHMLRIRHITLRNTNDFRQALCYIIFVCRNRRYEAGEEWYKKTVHALTQLLRRAAMRGMDKPPKEVVYWYLDPCIRSDDIEAHIKALADKEQITREDFIELFF